MNNKMNKENIVFKHTFYPAIELFNFDTAATL